MTTNTKSKPTHRAYTVDGDGENARWTEIGAAFAHQDGNGFNIQLAPNIAISDRMVLRVAKSKEAKG